MGLKSVIEKMISEGKNDTEIAVAVSDYKEGGKQFSTESVVDMILAGRKAAEIQESLSAKIAQKLAAEAAEAKAKNDESVFEQKLDEKLKSVGISLAKYQTQKSLRRFNSRTGLIEDVSGVTDGYKAFNDLLKAIVCKDHASTKSISEQIDRDNDRYEAELGGKATPTVSDVAPRGGNAIPVEVLMKIEQLVQASSLILPLVNRDHVIYESKIYPVMYGIDVDYIADQTTALTEKNPTFTNPTVNMQRIGAFSAISNTILFQKGADLVHAFIAAYASAVAKKLDQQITIGCVSGNSDKVNGIVFDPLTELPTPIALTSLTVDNIWNVINTLSSDSSMASTMLLANRKVAGKIGLLETTGGLPYFPQYINGGKTLPFGVPLATIPQISSTLDVAGANRTTGTSDVLICADMSRVIVGLSRDVRIDTSQDFLFTQDSLVMRVIQDFGCKVISGASTAGVVAVAQELTN